MQRKEVIDPSTNNRLTLPSASSRKESRYEDQREIHEDSKAYVPTGAPKNFNTFQGAPTLRLMRREKTRAAGWMNWAS
jgi:hypothetical protein